MGSRSAAIACVAAALVAGCGSEDRTVDDSDLPYSYSYPKGFGRAEDSPACPRSSKGTAIARGAGADLVCVQVQPLRKTVTPKLLPTVKRELAQSVHTAGRVRSTHDITVGGIRGINFRIDLKQRGTAAAASWTYLPKGRRLYWINCQWQTEQAQVLKACQTVLDTLRTR